MAMFVAFVVFVLLLGLAGALRLTADSREAGDWAPTEDGLRPRRSL